MHLLPLVGSNDSCAPLLRTLPKPLGFGRMNHLCHLHGKVTEL